MTVIYDGHAHLGTEEESIVRMRAGIVSMMCAGTPDECRRLEREAAAIQENGKNSSRYIIPAYGLHPWHSAEYTVKDMMPWLKEAAVIGEIGMDSVWCDVPLVRQREVFEEQLSYACQNQKPVVLHTKGQEKEIAALIRNYPNCYLVHWYSDMEGLDDYLEQNCYFTLGPDLETNPAVRKVLSLAPANRLLVETDGWSGVEWAVGKKEVEELPLLLKRNMQIFAEQKELSKEKAAKQMEKNFYCFLSGQKII